MPTTCLQEHLHLNSVLIQLSVFIHISVSLHAFLSSYYRSVYFCISRVIAFWSDLIFAEWFGDIADDDDDVS